MICSISALSSTWAHGTEALTFLFNSMLINVTLISHRGLVATILESMALNDHMKYSFLFQFSVQINSK